MIKMLFNRMLEADMHVLQVLAGNMFVSQQLFNSFGETIPLLITDYHK